MELVNLTEQDYEKMGGLFVSVEGISRSTQAISERKIDDVCSNLGKCSLEEKNTSQSIVGKYPDNNICHGVETWEGFLLGVKIIIRPDGFVMIFAIAKTPYWRITYELVNLDPKYTTRLKEGCYMWRETPGVAYRLFQELKRIDATLRRSL